MIDLRPTIIAKSDQLNADDLIAGPMTLTITDVRLLEAADQPVAVHWEGGEGRPFKPCKSMRRVMAKVWGEDGKAFIGQRMTVYRDERVRFGADAVGGIRISHMSGIDRDVTMALMVTRGKRAPYTVKPLAAERGAVNLAPILAEGREAAARGSAALSAWWGRLSRDEKAAAKPALDNELKALAINADQAALNNTEISDAEPSPSDTAPETPASDGFPQPRTDAGDTFPGDGPASEAETAEPAEANADDGTGSAVDVLGRVERVIADFEFKSLAELKQTQADRRFKAFLAAVRGQDEAAADRVELALTKALESFG